jgi:hypothetical protein
VNQKDAKEHLMSYSIKLAGNAEDGTEQRAVMVIKSKSKTKAKQRKGALSNWKVRYLQNYEILFSLLMTRLMYAIS